jgi:anti-sigma-K factor RskA
MKMRQSLAQFEAAFHEQAAENRVIREEVRRTTAQRARVRRAERVQKHGTLRFFALVMAIVATAVIVTVVMFDTLSRVAG